MNKIDFRVIPFLVLLFCLSGCDDGENYWQSAAREDIAYMRSQILENHPGPVNAEDPLFGKQLESNYNEALERILHVKTREDYWQLMKKFTTAFNDGHLRVFERNKKKAKEEKKKGEPFVFDEVAPQIAWIRIPTFEPDEEQRVELANMLKMLKHLRNYRAIVFDLHGNRGGNSEWARKIIESLFSEGYMQQCMYETWQSIHIDYRVSTENIAHLKNMARSFGKLFGKENELAKGYADFADSMRMALERGDTLVRVPKGDYRQPTKKFANPVHATIILIIDHHCASACLDFIDYIKSLQHPVFLFGEATAADTLYMDIREVKLPRGQGNFVFPIKVYRGRLRGNNEPYRPDIPYSGDMKDTPRLAASVYQFITSLRR